MFLKGNEDVEGNEDLLPCQSFEINFGTKNNQWKYTIEKVWLSLLYLRGMAEGPDYIGVEA